jgi:hypothetical protein
MSAGGFQCCLVKKKISYTILTSVPDPDPPDHMFLGLPDRIWIYKSEVWIRIRIQILLTSFYHQAKIVRKTLILLFCEFFWTCTLNKQ